MNGDRPSATADLVWSLVWVAAGGAIFAGGYGMDRLESQHINPYTAPGLVPAALGVGIFVLGAFLLVRSVRNRPAVASNPGGAASLSRLLLAAGLCVAYGAGLVGRGPPFWLATALFVFVAIVAFRWPELKARGEIVKGVMVAAACAAGTAASVTLVFQELFLVRLP